MLAWVIGHPRWAISQHKHCGTVHITYTTGTCALPEYTQAPSGRLCVYFRQSTLTCGISITYCISYCFKTILLYQYKVKNCIDLSHISILQQVLIKLLDLNGM